MLSAVTNTVDVLALQIYIKDFDCARKNKPDAKIVRQKLAQ